MVFKLCTARIQFSRSRTDGQIIIKERELLAKGVVAAMGLLNGIFAFVAPLDVVIVVDVVVEVVVAAAVARLEG